MDTQEIVRLYADEGWTLRRIARKFGSNHHLIERILIRSGVEINGKQPQREPMSDAHRRKIGETSKGRLAWNKGISADNSSRLRGMKARMRTGIDLTIYVGNIEKLQLLTGLQAKWKQYIAFDDTMRKAFLDKFYFDETFNAVYDAWVASGKNKWYYPSLDHKTPKANGGGWELDNLHFMTWFENRAKADMTLEEWDVFKKTTNTRSDLFIDSILHN